MVSTKCYMITYHKFFTHFITAFNTKDAYKFISKDMKLITFKYFIFSSQIYMYIRYLGDIIVAEPGLQNPGISCFSLSMAISNLSLG